MSIEIIAEMSWCHMGDMDLAERMIKSASESGVDYVKFQTWKVDNLKAGPWDEDGRREIYEKAELSDDNHLLLSDLCNKYGVKFLTSCFCIDDLDFIRRISNEIKIPSTECKNKNLVKKAIKDFDRVFISIGASTSEEWMPLTEYDNVVLLHCVSSYPCPAENVNLPKLKYLVSKSKKNKIGYSGHYLGIEDAVAAICLGATVIEKHFTVDRELPGRDNKFALYPSDFTDLIKFANLYTEMNNDLGIDFQPSEKEARDVYSGRWG